MNKDDVARLVDRLGSTLAGLETPMMQGDNLAITLCSAFDNPEQEVDEDTGWSPDAEAGYKEVCGAIHAHYAPTIEALADALTTLSAENEALKHDVQRQMAIALEHVNENATLSARVETLEAQQLSVLTGFYLKQPAAVAEICDTVLDRSGALLGRVRDHAAEVKSSQALAGDDHG